MLMRFFYAASCGQGYSRLTTAYDSDNTRNQVISFILALILCMALILVGFEPITNMLGRWASPAVVEVVAGFSVLTHFDGFQKGVLDSRDIIFFLSVIGFSLFTTSVILRTHRTS